MELFCSLGLQVIYTQILALTPLPRRQPYLYPALYIFVFMLTLPNPGLTGTYRRFANFLGGLVLLTFGNLLIFTPEKLMLWQAWGKFPTLRPLCPPREVLEGRYLLTGNLLDFGKVMVTIRWRELSGGRAG